MKIHLRQIIKTGLDLDLNPKDPWLMVILDTLFPGKNLDKATVAGSLHLQNLTGNIAVSGRISFKHREQCARCGAELDRAENIAITANLIPRTAITGEDPISKIEEKELTEDDLVYSFYDKEEVFIDPIVNDGIALALPLNYYCRDRATCDKTAADILKPYTDDGIDPRWESLRSLVPGTKH